MIISTNTGRVYRPKDCERLIVYLKDLNLPKPDKWGTSQLIAFLQQVYTHTCMCTELLRPNQAETAICSCTFGTYIYFLKFRAYKRLFPCKGFISLGLVLADNLNE